MVQGIVNAHPPVDLHGKPPRARKHRVANVVLGAGGAGHAKVAGPPIACGALSGGNEKADGARAAVSVAAALLLLATSALLLLLPARHPLAERGRRKEGLACQEARKLRAQPVDLGLEAEVEHVPDHGHAALHPLPAAAELLVIKLRHRAVTVYESLQQRHDRVGAYRVALRQAVDSLLAV